MSVAVRILLSLMIGFCLIPIIFPVWNETWMDETVNDGTSVSSSGQRVQDLLAKVQRWQVPGSAQSRGVLIPGPKPHAVTTYYIRNTAVPGYQDEYQTTALQFRADPSLGRMFLEVVVIAVPFLVAAGILFFRGQAKPTGGFSVLPLDP